MDGVIFTDGICSWRKRVDCHVMDIIYYPGINEYNGNRESADCGKELEVSLEIGSRKFLLESFYRSFIAPE